MNRMKNNACVHIFVFMYQLKYVMEYMKNVPLKGF